jgi:hypothetical protein
VCGCPLTQQNLERSSHLPRQSGLAKARTLFTDLRRRAHLELNKGEARNALARAVYFCRLNEMRDRTFESQFFA